MKNITLSILLFFASNLVFAQTQWANSGNNIYNTNTGNVGIGTTTPTVPLQVTGVIWATSKIVTNTLTYNQYDNFNYDNKTFQNYALGWVSDSWSTQGPTAWLTSWSGVKIFSQGQPRLSVHFNGNVGIGTTSPTQLLHVNGTTLTNKLFVGGVDNTHAGTYLLAVNGSAIFTRAVVKLYANWPDYVFDPDFQLRSLSSLEEYINQNKHLPDMPSAEEMQKKDEIDLGEMNTKLLQKVEELTLYVIGLKKQNDKLQKDINNIKKQK